MNIERALRASRIQLLVSQEVSMYRRRKRAGERKVRQISNIFSARHRHRADRLYDSIDSPFRRRFQVGAMHLQSTRASPVRPPDY